MKQILCSFVCMMALATTAGAQSYKTDENGGSGFYIGGTAGYAISTYEAGGVEVDSNGALGGLVAG